MIPLAKPDEFPMQPEYTDVFLRPGEMYTGTRPTRVTTILGSCVSVCVFDRDGTIGGMNHFLLPSANASASRSMRYGDVAVDQLIRRLLSMGTTRHRLVAKLFGGANVFRAFGDESRHIGAANVAMARAALARHDILVGAEDVGGTRGRKLVFSAPDGTAWVRLIGNTMPA